MIHELLQQLTEACVPAVDIIALIVIVYGSAEAFVRVISATIRPLDPAYARDVWLKYSRWLVAGLTFQLAADILETSTAPSWDEVGKLGAIAVIRTFLNFFLERDQKEVREREVAAEPATRSEVVAR